MTTSHLARRTAGIAAAAAILTGSGLLAAPAASAAPADGHSPIAPQAQDQGPSTKEMVRLKDGCFVASYEDDTWASVTLYWKNRCSRAHRLHIDPVGHGAAEKTITVAGHGHGSKRYWNWTRDFNIYDYGRA
jgi:hypothetical protein